MNNDGKLPQMRVTYDPETQRGAILRLRALWGAKTFAQYFLPIGINGKKKPTWEEKGKGKREPEKGKEKREPEKKKRKKELTPEEEEEERIRQIRREKDEIIRLRRKKEEERYEQEGFFMPVESLVRISMFMFKSMMDPVRAADLIILERESVRYHIILQDRLGYLERALSRELLGAEHTRSREERRIGLNPDVATTYGWVIDFLNKDERLNLKPIKLQTMAIENAEISPELIDAWPWWFFDLLSNRRTKESLSKPFYTSRQRRSDGYAGSVVTITGTLSGDPDRHIYDSEYYAIPTLLHNVANPFDTRLKWESGSAGADLVVIPLDVIHDRAITHYKERMKRHPFVSWREEIEVFIRIGEPVPEVEVGEITDKTKFRKEVVIVGVENIQKSPDITVKLRVKLGITHAFLPKKTIEFLENPLLGGTGDIEYLNVEDLSLEHVYFDGRSDGSINLLAQSSEVLKSLIFGPSNLDQAPFLPCPAYALTTLALTAAPGRSLEWNIGEPNCYPKLVVLSLDGNIPVWKESNLKSMVSLFSLAHIELVHFRGSGEDLEALFLAFMELSTFPRQRSLNVHISFEDRTRVLEDEIDVANFESEHLSIGSL